MTMEIKEIMTKLNHRYPFLLVDRIVELEVDQRIKGYKNITFNEPYFSGHFPENPIFPGVFIIESMAQVGGLMFSKRKKGFLVAVDNAKFTEFVTPGDRLMTEATLMKEFGKYAKVAVTGKVEEKIVAKAEVTYYFDETANERRPAQGSNALFEK